MHVRTTKWNVFGENRLNKEIILVIRRNKEYWLNNDYKSSQHSLVCQVFDSWNSSFGIDIIDFRNRIRDIAASTYLDNKFDRIFLHSHYDPRILSKQLSSHEKEIYKDSIIVPMDEDDWISVDLASILREIETDKQFFIWNCYRSFSGLEHKSFKEDKSGLQMRGGKTFTCTWAIKGYHSCLERRNSLKLSREEFNQTYLMDKCLTVCVNHVGSLGYCKIIANSPDKTKWIDTIVQKLTCELSLNIDFPDAFQRQWIPYRKLLRELLASYKYLTDEHQKLLETPGE